MNSIAGRLGTIVVAAALALVASLLLAGGQAREPAKKTPALPAAAPPQTPQLAMPDAERIVLLVRTTLLTLNDALQSGNFTVLRDVAAPDFAKANSAARLSTVFGNLARRHIDLTAVAILLPQLTEAPVLDQNNRMLRIKGFFSGQPVRLDFEVVYQAVNGRWRLFGLSVQPTNVAPVADLVSPAAPRPPDVQAKKKVSEAKAERARK